MYVAAVDESSRLYFLVRLATIILPSTLVYSLVQTCFTAAPNCLSFPSFLFSQGLDFRNSLL